LTEGAGIEKEFKRRIKTQTVLPSAETAAMLFWALMASGQITTRKVDGWQSLAEKPTEQTMVDLAAWSNHHHLAGDLIQAIPTQFATAPLREQSDGVIGELAGRPQSSSYR